MCYKYGCPPDFKGYNGHKFRKTNIVDNMLECKPGIKEWNNIHNASMHFMLKCDDKELNELIAPDMPWPEFQLLNPEEIGVLLQDWFA